MKDWQASHTWFTDLEASSSPLPQKGIIRRPRKCMMLVEGRCWIDDEGESCYSFTIRAGSSSLNLCMKHSQLSYQPLQTADLYWPITCGFRQRTRYHGVFGVEDKLHGCHSIAIVNQVQALLARSISSLMLRTNDIFQYPDHAPAGRSIAFLASFSSNFMPNNHPKPFPISTTAS